MLGHASASMTLDVYGHLFDETLDDGALKDSDDAFSEGHVASAWPDRLGRIDGGTG